MMNNTGGWMNSWMGGGMWIWTVLGTVLVVVAIVAITRMAQK